MKITRQEQMKKSCLKNKTKQTTNKGNEVGLVVNHRAYILPFDGNSISTVPRDSYESRGK